MCAKSNFFDFRENLLRKPERPVDASRPPLTVTQLTADIERAIKGGLPQTVSVKGEVSNYNVHRASGHHYFTLKDTGACIDAVLWKSDASRLKFLPTDGMEVVATGRVGLYAQRGRYQLIANTLQPLGQGALGIAFQQMRAKLEAEGLFAESRKRVLPRYPRRIVLVTSVSTAALADMLKVLRRFRFLSLRVYHVPVQGEGSAAKIAQAIAHLNQHRSGSESDSAGDVIVLGRGGGSLEDLWAFNEEPVARAIAASRIPIVTGIGHEVDVSIADLVADYHAHTPTEAARIVTRHWQVAPDSMRTGAARLNRAIGTALSDAKGRLASIARHEFFRRPTERLNLLRQRLDDDERRLHITIERRLNTRRRRLDELAGRLATRSPQAVMMLRRQRLAHLDAAMLRASKSVLTVRGQRCDTLEARLEALSPVGVLKRGYSITSRAKDGAIIRSANELKKGDSIATRFADGEVKSVVEDGSQMKLFE